MSNIIGEEKAKIVLEIDRMNGPAPVHHICKKCGVENAEELLRQLEQDGIIGRASPISESMSNVVQYMLTTEAKNQLQQLVANQLEQLITRPQVVRIHTKTTLHSE